MTSTRPGRLDHHERQQMTFRLRSAEAAPQWFVKFFGSNTMRADRTLDILDEVKRSGNHFACPYPRGRRPRAVRDGAVIYMGRLVSDPNDILIYGKAIGSKHDPLRDDASEAEVQLRPW